MHLTIAERKFAIRSVYDISCGNQSWYARKQYFSWNDKLLLRGGDDGMLARIQGFFSFFREKHEFRLGDGRVYRFHCEKIWKGVYLCEGNGEAYRLYRHKGRNFSIFAGDEQIAAATKNKIVINKGNRFEVDVNADADVVLVICMLLTINSGAETDSDPGATVTVDLGNVGPEERKFDRTWQPKG